MKFGEFFPLSKNYTSKIIYLKIIPDIQKHLIKINSFCFVLINWVFSFNCNKIWDQINREKKLIIGQLLRIFYHSVSCKSKLKFLNASSNFLYWKLNLELLFASFESSIFFNASKIMQISPFRSLMIFETCWVLLRISMLWLYGLYLTAKGRFIFIANSLKIEVLKK